MSRAAPRLRSLDLIPVQSETGPLLCLRDPERYATSQVFLPQAAIPLVLLMDGHHTLGEIEREYAIATGARVSVAEIRELADKLDELYLLEGPRFDERRRAEDAAFAAMEARPAALAGLSYPAEADHLRRLLDSFYDHADGPGPPGDPAEPVAAVLAPHIDFPRGGPVYAHAYRAVAEGAGEVDTFVILATAHRPMDGYFALTRKDFDTPLGRVATDRDLVDELAAAIAGAGGEPFGDESAHRNEHSVEFQVVQLQHLFGGRRDFRIVPVLVGSFHALLGSGRLPGEDPQIQAFVAALAAILERKAERAMVVGGVDLAHVGPQFGDGEPVSAADRERLARRDLAMLDRVCAGDAAGLWRTIEADGDATRVCGFPPIMTMLMALRPAGGRVLSYGQYPDPRAVVTYAGVAFPRTPA